MRSQFLFYIRDAEKKRVEHNFESKILQFKQLQLQAQFKKNVWKTNEIRENHEIL